MFKFKVVMSNSNHVLFYLFNGMIFVDLRKQYSQLYCLTHHSQKNKAHCTVWQKLFMTPTLTPTSVLTTQPVSFVSVTTVNQQAKALQPAGD